MSTLDHEASRLAAVARYDVLDTPPDGAFDRIASLAARWFGAPIATVSIVDSDRIWFKAVHGLDGVTQIGRDPGLCASAILQDEPYLVTDARVDPRTLDNPLVHGELGIRFYAAAPIITSDGYRLGTVNVLDTRPHGASEEDLAVLADLAALVVDELELRLSALATVRREREYRVELEELTRTLQTTLLPPSLPTIPGMEVASAYRAASRSQVGGDFYDLFTLAGDGWAFFLGDVQGHGPEAAAVTSLIRYTLRAAAQHHTDPAACLRELNETLCRDEQTERFCTVLFGLVRPHPDGEGHLFTIATGGHPPALWIRPGEGMVEIVRPEGGMLVGVLPEAQFDQCTVHLRPGETLVFHTDGLTESRTPRAGDLLGEAVMLDYVRNELPASAVAAVTALEQLADATSPSDDIALLAFTPTPAVVPERVPDGAPDGDPYGSR